MNKSFSINWFFRFVSINVNFPQVDCEQTSDISSEKQFCKNFLATIGLYIRQTGSIALSMRVAINSYIVDWPNPNLPE